MAKEQRDNLPSEDESMGRLKRDLVLFKEGKYEPGLAEIAITVLGVIVSIALAPSGNWWISALLTLLGDGCILTFRATLENEAKDLRSRSELWVEQRDERLADNLQRAVDKLEPRVNAAHDAEITLAATQALQNLLEVMALQGEEDVSVLEDLNTGLKVVVADFKAGVNRVSNGIVPVNMSGNSLALYKTQQQLIENTRESLKATHYFKDLDSLRKWCPSNRQNDSSDEERKLEGRMQQFYDYIIKPQEKLADGIEKRRLFIVMNDVPGVQNISPHAVDLFTRVLERQIKMGFEFRYIQEEAVLNALIDMQVDPESYYDDILISDSNAGFIFRQERGESAHAYKTVTQDAIDELNRKFETLWNAATKPEHASGEFSFFRDYAQSAGAATRNDATVETKGAGETGKVDSQSAGVDLGYAKNAASAKEKGGTLEE